MASQIHVRYLDRFSRTCFSSKTKWRNWKSSFPGFQQPLLTALIGNWTAKDRSTGNDPSMYLVFAIMKRGGSILVIASMISGHRAKGNLARSTI
nr:hypothetical protein [Candidatus Sigynarchaeota archaeon]